MLGIDFEVLRGLMVTNPTKETIGVCAAREHMEKVKELVFHLLDHEHPNSWKFPISNPILQTTQ